MLPQFYLKREQSRQLYACEATNVHVDFHFHSHVELLVVLEGQIDVTINNMQKVLSSGEIAVALSFDAHRFFTPKCSRGISIVIPTDMCADFLSIIGDHKAHCPFLCNEDLYNTVCTCYAGIIHSSNSISQKGYLYVMLGALFENIQLEQQSDSDPKLFTQLLNYINKNYTSDISLQSIAQTFGYNASYLSRVFNSQFYISVPKYITMLRLRHVVMMMQEPGTDITECAYESGFQSLRTFYRAFREEFQCNPKEYKHNRH